MTNTPAPEGRLTDKQMAPLRMHTAQVEADGYGPSQTGQLLRHIDALAADLADKEATIARVEAERDALLAIPARMIEKAPPVNYELRHDGSEDPLAAAYVNGWHEAYDTAVLTIISALRPSADTGGTDG